MIFEHLKSESQSDVSITSIGDTLSYGFTQTVVAVSFLVFGADLISGISENFGTWSVLKSGHFLSRTYGNSCKFSKKSSEIKSVRSCNFKY